MKDGIRVKLVDARAYFASVGMGLQWYNYEELKKIRDLRLTTTAIGSLPTQLAQLVAEDAAEMGLAA